MLEHDVCELCGNELDDFGYCHLCEDVYYYEDDYSYDPYDYYTPEITLF